jgi:hypothetical protein
VIEETSKQFVSVGVVLPSNGSTSVGTRSLGLDQKHSRNMVIKHILILKPSHQPPSDGGGVHNHGALSSNGSTGIELHYVIRDVADQRNMTASAACLWRRCSLCDHQHRALSRLAGIIIMFVVGGIGTRTGLCDKKCRR